MTSDKFSLYRTSRLVIILTFYFFPLLPFFFFFFFFLCSTSSTLFLYPKLLFQIRKITKP